MSPFKSWIASFQNHIEVLVSLPQIVTLFGNKGTVDVNSEDNVAQSK